MELWTQDTSIEKRRLKKLLLELAFHFNDDYGYAWPGRGELAAKLKVGVTTIHRALVELQKLGIITRHSSYTHGRGYSSRWVVFTPEQVRAKMFQNDNATPPINVPKSTGHVPKMFPKCSKTATHTEAQRSDPPEVTDTPPHVQRAREIDNPVLEWVLNHSKMKGSNRLLLLAFAQMADANGVVSGPGLVTKLAKKNVTSSALGESSRVRTVRRALSHVVDSGELKVVGHGPRGASIYSIPMERV